jgi:hypothetical protein
MVRLLEIEKSNLRYNSALKMYHQFEGNSTDTTTNVHDGTDTAITYGNDYGVFNQGALFNGTTSKIVLADHDDWYFYDAEFTLGFWCKWGNPAGEAFLGQYVDAQNFWGFYLGSSTTLVFYGKFSNADKFYYTAPLSPSVGNWYWIVVCRRVNSCYMYVNGNAVAVTPSVNFTASANLATGLEIGKYYTSNYFNGSMDDLFLIKGVGLTAEQIYYLYNHRSVGVMK